MADTKLTAMTNAASLLATDIIYVVVDPTGSPLDRKATLSTLQTRILTGGTVTTDITIPSSGLKIKDAGADHTITVSMQTNLSANRTLNLYTQNADTNLSLQGNLTVEATSVINQDLTSDATAQFASLNLTDAAVTQPATALGSTSTFALIKPLDSLKGGAQILGFSDTDATAAWLGGVIGVTDPTDTTSAVTFFAGRSDGGTASAAMGAAETCFQFDNYTTHLITVLGSGNTGFGTTSPGSNTGLSTRIDAVASNANWGPAIIGRADSVGRGMYLLTNDYNGSTNTGGSLNFLNYSTYAAIQSYKTGYAANADLLINTDGGNVGFGMGSGTNVPKAKVHVAGGVAAGLNDVLWVSGGAAAAGSGPCIVFHDWFGNNANPTWRMAEIGSVYRNDGATWDCDLVFYTNTGSSVTSTSEKMRLTGKNGYLGIGTSSPIAALDLRDGAIAFTDANISQPATTIAAATVGARLGVLGDDVGGLEILGLTDTSQTAIRLHGVMGTTNPDDATACIHLYGSKSDGGTNGVALGASETVFALNTWSTRLLTVLGNGNVGIGQDSPAAKLEVVGTNGTWYFSTGGSDFYNSVAGANKIYCGNAAGYLSLSSGSRDTGDLVIAASTAYVGIGETTPLSKLHVRGSDTGGSVTAGAYITLEHTGTTYLQFVSNNNQQQGIMFGDTDSTSSGAITYAHDTNLLNVSSSANVWLSANAGNAVAKLQTSGQWLIKTQASDLNSDTDFAGIYSKDVAGSAELIAVDEANNRTQLTSHYDIDLAEAAGIVIDPDDDFPEIHHSENPYLGLETLKYFRLDGTVQRVTRKLPAEKIRDWDADQQEAEDLRNTERLVWDQALASRDPDEPTPSDKPPAYVKRDKPKALKRKEAREKLKK